MPDIDFVPYRLANQGQTTVATVHLPGDATLVVKDASSLPSSVPFLVTVSRRTISPESVISYGQSCIFEVSAVNGNTLTVDTVEGTTDIGFSPGDSVENRITAGTIEQISDALASLISSTESSLDDLNEDVGEIDACIATLTDQVADLETLFARVDNLESQVAILFAQRQKSFSTAFSAAFG